MAIDPTQLAELWKANAATLQLLARARCDFAEDCVQEAFVRLATQEPIPDEPIAWLVRVVRNRAIDLARQEQRRRNREKQIAEEQPQWFVEPLRDQNAIHPSELQHALSKLDCETREIVIAHLWGGLSFRQIANAYEISSTSAHRRYVLAIDQLRSLLKCFQNET